MGFKGDGEVGAALLGGGVLLVFDAESLVAQQQGGRLQFGVEVAPAVVVAGVAQLGANLAAILPGKGREAPRSPRPAGELAPQRRGPAVEDLVEEVVQGGHCLLLTAY